MSYKVRANLKAYIISQQIILFIAPLIDKMVTVSEEWIAIAILRLVEMEKAVVEGGGASGVAAILAGLLPELAGKK